MVEKGVPLGRSGGVVDSSDGENYPSAVATLAAEHPQRHYNLSWWRRTGMSDTFIQASLEARKQRKQEVIAKMVKEIEVINSMLEELKK